MKAKFSDILDSDDDDWAGARAANDRARHGGQANFKKLLEECTALNNQMIRSQIIVGSEKPMGNAAARLQNKDNQKASVGLDDVQYRLYGMHINKIPDFVNNANAGSDHQIQRNLTQLHEQLKRERQKKHFGTDMTQEEMRADFEEKQMGRDFFMKKKFDVGEFEADLKNFYSLHFDYEEKFNKQPSAATPMSSLQPTQNTLIRSNASFCEDSRSANLFKAQMIEESVSANQRAHLSKQDSVFYKRLAKRFNQVKKQSKDAFPVDRSPYQASHMPSLSTVKLPKDRSHTKEFSQMDDIRIEDVIFRQGAIEALDEERELNNILEGRPVFNEVNLGYVKNLLAKVQQRFFQNIQVKGMTMGAIAAEKSRQYQAPLHRQVYELLTAAQADFDVSDQQRQSIINLRSEKGMDADEAEMNELNNIIFDKLMGVKVEKRRVQQVRDFAQQLVDQLDYDLQTMSQKDTFTLHEEQQFRDNEKLISIWIAIREFALEKLTKIDQVLKSSEQVNLFGNKEQLLDQLEAYRAADEDHEIALYAGVSDDEARASTLCKALEVKFNKDLALSGHSDADKYDKARSFSSAKIMRNNVKAYWNNNDACHPYAVIFILFMAGEHEVARQVADRHASGAFCELYRDYSIKYKCRGLPKAMISNYVSLIEEDYKHQSADGGREEDLYKHLLVSLMTGSLYKDDAEFRQRYLFNNLEVQLWIYLKLASFSYINEKGENLSSLLPVDLPVTHKEFRLRHLREKINQIYLNRDVERKDEDGGLLAACDKLELAQALFFSGQFELFFSYLMSSDQRYFIDLAFIGIQLQQLSVLATKFGFTRLLYSKSSRDRIVSVLDQKDLLKIYTGQHTKERAGCLDLDAVLGQYLDLMRETEVNVDTFSGERHTYNTMTDACCLSQLMQDEMVSRAFLALYVLNNQHNDNAIETVLEVKGKEYLTFKDSVARKQAKIATGNFFSNITGKNIMLDVIFKPRKMTLKEFLSNDQYKEFVKKIVEFNRALNQPHDKINLMGMLEQQQIDSFDINIVLLDRIFEREHVLRILIEYQYQHINKHAPKDFLRPTIDKQLLASSTQQLVNLSPIPLVSQDKAKIVDSNKAKFREFKELKVEFDYIELITRSLNYVIKGNFQKALESMQQVKSIPLQVQDKANIDGILEKFVRQPIKMKWLLLNLVIASAKCLYLEALNLIKSEGHEVRMALFEAKTSHHMLSQRVHQVQNLSLFIDAISEREPSSVFNLNDHLGGHRAGKQSEQLDQMVYQQFQDKLQSTGAMLRRILMEIQDYA